ncbi:MAG TPA: 2-phospho-L-lactate guanylyltransferase [Chloroflexi bacterium]|nr:2-phospho-L-lactate guanylyltransferase [Chloroflexota bacterium]
MTLWAIVPIKPMRLGKSRLATVLSEEERAALNRQLLARTVETLKSVPELEQVLVVSRDTAALALARKHGARTVLEDDESHLNMALARATFVARRFNTHGILVLPADLPLLRAEDVRALLEAARQPPAVVIVPDRKREGTNALVITPPGLISYHFGPGSFRRHCDLAREAGARLEVLELPSLAIDLDWPEDLKLLEEQNLALR